MTDAQFIAWLKDVSAIRCVLMEVGVKVGGVEKTRFLSNRGYVTKPTDTPANTSYSPYITGGIKFTETLSLEGTASLSFGDIEIDNFSGDRDGWLNDIWNNRPVKVFIGDIKWSRSEFRQIFDGMVVGIDTKNRGSLNLKLADKMQRLNTPVSETKLGGNTQNKDKLIPLCFGECHNIEPLLVDSAVNEYQVHNGPIEGIIEVRDNGVPVQFTPYLTTGKFRLNQQPAGQITCSVQGDKQNTYVNDAASIIKRLVTGFGSVDRRFSTSELNLTAFAAYTASNPAPVGLYLGDRANVVDCCNKLAVSNGGRVMIGRDGKLTIIKLNVPVVDTTSIIEPKDIVMQSLSISNMPPVVAGVQIGYCKNWKVQEKLQTGIPANHADLFAQEWLTVTRTDSLTAQDYQTFVEPVMQETLLLTAADATAEANRRLNMYNVQRRVYKYTGLAHLMLEQLGGTQTLINSRYGLQGGAKGQIVSLATDWLNPHITVEILV